MAAAVAVPAPPTPERPAPSRPSVAGEHRSETVPTLLLSGTTGAGKSTLAAAVNDLLAERAIPNVAVDVDALCWQWPPAGRFNQDLAFEALAALWPVHRRHGVRRAVLARVVEKPQDLDRYREALPGAEITVCRVLAPEALRLARLRRRMPPGPELDWHLARSLELESILAAAAVESFTVVNDERSPRDVAVELLGRVGWIEGPTGATSPLRGGAPTR